MTYNPIWNLPKDEGILELTSSGAAPTETADRLYNVNGELFWNANNLVQSFITSTHVGDGSTTTFTHTQSTSQERALVFVDGTPQNGALGSPGPAYTVSGANITFDTDYIPLEGQIIFIVSI